MAEDQSVVGRRRIYYDQHGSEALICSDSEEENIEPEVEKHEFSEGEDRILWYVRLKNCHLLRNLSFEGEHLGTMLWLKS